MTGNGTEGNSTAGNNTAGNDMSLARRNLLDYPIRRLHKILPLIVVLGVILFGLFSCLFSQASMVPAGSTGSRYFRGSHPGRSPASGRPAGYSASSGTAHSTSSGPHTEPPSASGVSPASTTGPITYEKIRKSYVAAGRVLFEATCASCHGTNAFGTSRAPNLVGLGAGTVDLWVSSGWMPLENLTLQPAVKPPKYTPKQAHQIADFVASLSKVNGPGIPQVDLHNANVANGLSLFALNCAACHTITGSGDTLASGYFAPTLHLATKTQIGEAVRTGPGNMPRFSSKQLSNKQLADLIAYVTSYIQHPVNRGGLALGGVGPVAEGFIALLIGVGGLMLFAFWIGDRRR